MKKRTAIIGGTFDPIHVGHLIIAETARHDLGVDKILFMPAGMPPHKLERAGGASNEDRADMVRLAIKDNTNFDIFMYEMEKNSESFLYETLEYLKSAEPETEFYFIIGGDSLRDFQTWRKPEKIAECAVLAAACRDKVDNESFELYADKLRNMYNATVVKINSPLMEISSSDIRNKVKNDVSIRYLVPEKVRQYIESHGLYK